MTITSAMDSLEPASVWRHFQAICAIPRPSKHEEAISGHVRAWAEARGLVTDVDGAGNLLIRKKATPGREGSPGIALQAHLDMVCQAEGGWRHDFMKDPIDVERSEGWLLAPHTTLGADNGIGVALALAALEDETLAHGPLEVLLTVDEEAGMGGAHGLQPDWLTSRRMLNLDTEEWGEFYLGCAGGCDVNVERAVRREPLPAAVVLRELAVSGLRGGHSGGDIHLGRANAPRLLVRALRCVERALAPGSLRLAAMHGGNARNALAREAAAIVAVPAASVIDARLAQLQFELRAEFAGVDDAVSLSWRSAEAESVISTADQESLLGAIERSPYGVAAMSSDFPGVVETSNNLGIVRLADGEFSANLMVRSLRDDGARELAARIERLWREAGCRVAVEGHYPGWTPNPGSQLLALAQRVYRSHFGAEARVKVIHAGLECGIIGAKYPGMDTVSLGPTIRGPHAPGERVDIDSVAKTWQLLRALLAAV